MIRLDGESRVGLEDCLVAEADRLAPAGEPQAGVCVGGANSTAQRLMCRRKIRANGLDSPRRKPGFAAVLDDAVPLADAVDLALDDLAVVEDQHGAEGRRRYSGVEGEQRGDK